MKYDLSRVPRPLYTPSLKCWCVPSSECWVVAVGDEHFQVYVTKAHDARAAEQLVTEIRNVLRAHRLLAGTATFFDTHCTDHVR